MSDSSSILALTAGPPVARSVAGGSDRKAATEPFSELYRSTAADVYAYVASLLGDRSAAEDVTALAFERAYRARGRHDPRRGSPRAWLFGIARNAALDELRRRRRSGLPVGDALVAEPVADAAGDEQIVLRETVRAALSALSPPDREVVLLKFHGDLSNGELARVLGVSESNAGTRLHRALTRLRRACEPEALA